MSKSRVFLYVSLAALFVYACNGVKVKVSPEDVCAALKAAGQECVPSPTPSPEKWADGTLVCASMLIHPPAVCPGDCAGEQWPNKCVCPVGTAIVWSSGSHGSHGSIGCDPIASPPPIAPSPIPATSPTPSPSPEPVPSPSPEPVPTLSLEQGVEYELLQEVDPALAERFYREGYSARLADAIRDAQAELTGCARSKFPCPLPVDCQTWHERLAARLREQGYYAGQHNDRNHPEPWSGHPSDDIAAGFGPTQNVPAWTRGITASLHDCKSDGNAGWDNKTPDNERALWRKKGTAPSPEPQASPSAPPTPKPEDPNKVATASISPASITLHAGQSASFTCTPKNKAGQVVDKTADNIFIGACMHAGCLGAGDFTSSKGNNSATVRIANGLKKTGQILVNCAWYGEASTSNAVVNVQ